MMATGAVRGATPPAAATAGFDDDALKVVGLYHGELRTMISLTSVALALLAFSDGFQRRALRDATLLTALATAGFAVWFGRTADVEYVHNIRARQHAWSPAAMDAASRWRVVPTAVTLGLVIACGAGAVGRFFSSDQRN